MSASNDEILLKINDVYEPTEKVKALSHFTPDSYKLLYKESIENPEAFWAEIAGSELSWFKKWDKTFEWDYPNYRWFSGGKINASYNCLDRHISTGFRNKVAYIWVDENMHEKKITFGELHEQVSRFANGLKSLGVKKGDAVTINMAMTIEHVIAVLACARIGAIHSVVFGGFGAQALRLRIEDSRSKVVITNTWTQRRGKRVMIKSIVDEAVDGIKGDITVIVAQREGDNLELVENERDFHNLMETSSPVCEPEHMDAEDPLFILYTSGTTGKPKGVVHTTGGYLLHTHFTTKTVFDLHADDIFWCTADIGWITGHSYVVYGPLSMGITSIICEGAPDYPNAAHWWSIIEKYRVNVFYSAPTAIRMFMKHGTEWTKNHDTTSLRILGSVGEPINPEAWVWYHENIGKSQATVVDTWWQTETGGHMITTLPSIKQKPGKAGMPFFGIEAAVVDKSGNPIPPNTVGNLIIKKPWPSALRTCWNAPERFEKYWNQIDGVYFAGDLASIDDEGYIMILGRSDDVLNVAGHRIGTAEVESALITHSSVAESAAIGIPHDVKGESIKAFVVLKEGTIASDHLKDEIKLRVRRELGSVAVPDDIEFVDKLHKTRSGKIMRRVYKAKELGLELGDLSTIED